MSDKSLLAFAVLFMFCLRRERLLQIVLSLRALKKMFLFCYSFFSALFQEYYKGASAHSLVFLV